MLNRLMILLIILIQACPLLVLANSYEPAITVFDTNNTIENYSAGGYRSPIFKTENGILYTGRNNIGYVSLYFLKSNAPEPVEVNIPLGDKEKYYRPGSDDLKKIGSELFILHMGSTDDVFYFDNKSYTLKRWEPYYRLRDNSEIKAKLSDPTPRLMSDARWISVLDNGKIIISAFGNVYSYDYTSDTVNILKEKVTILAKLMQNDGDNVFFESDGGVYKTNGNDIELVINEPESRQSLIYRNAGDSVYRNRYAEPKTDAFNKNVSLIQFELSANDTIYDTGPLYVVSKNASYQINIKEGFKYSRESGFVSEGDEFYFLVKKGGERGDKYEVQQCKVTDSVNCKNFEVMPEITSGLTFAALYQISEEILLINAQYEVGGIVESKVIYVNPNTVHTKVINVNKDKNVLVDVIAKDDKYLFFLTKNVLDSKYLLHKYDIKLDKVSEISGLNNYNFALFDSFIINSQLFTFRKAKISESLLDTEEFYGLYRLDEKTNLLSLVFQSNFGRETGGFSYSGVVGIKKVRQGIVSSSVKSDYGDPQQRFKKYIFRVDRDLTKSTLFENSISSWVDTELGFVFVDNNTVYIESDLVIKELYKYSDSSPVRLLEIVSYKNGKVLFNATSADNLGYMLDIVTGDILPVVEPTSNGYMVSQPTQCGDGVFYAWSNYNTNITSIWKTDGNSTINLDINVNDFSVINNKSNLLVTLDNYGYPREAKILTVDCKDHSTKTLFTARDQDANSVRIERNEIGDNFIYSRINDAAQIFYIDERSLSLQHIYAGSSLDHFVPSANLINRTINGFFYQNSHVFNQKELTPIASWSEKYLMTGSDYCKSDYDDPKGWITCSVSERTDNGFSVEKLRILDTLSMKFSDVNLKYLEPKANIEHLTYSNGRYFFYANVVGIGGELLSIDQDCFYELDSGADSCTLPAPNSTPNVYEHKAQSYYQGQYVYLPIRVVDENFDTLTFKLSTQGDNWLSISNDGVLKGIVPANEKAGTHKITVEISDGKSQVLREIELEILNRGNSSTPSVPPSEPTGGDSGNASGGGSVSLSLLLLLFICYFPRARRGGHPPLPRCNYLPNAD